MDKKIYTTAFTMCLSLLLISCTQEPASIVRHSASSPAKAGFATSNPYKAMVEKGDTLYSIAKRNNVEVRAVIDSNNMRPPYTLIPGQTIKLPKAAFHIASDSDTLYAISRSYNVDIGRLAQKNGLTPPYSLTKGQKLFLPSSTANDSGSTTVASNIQYDFGTKESYGGSRAISSEELAPIGSAAEKLKPQVLASNDDESPFSTSVSEEKLSPAPAQKTQDAVKETENFDKKEAEPFAYKSESEFGNSSSEETIKPAPKTPEVISKKVDTSSVNNNMPTPIASSPMPVLSPAKTATATPVLATAGEEEEPFVESKPTKTSNNKNSKNGFIWPASGKIISGFGPKKGGLYNDGINISAKPGAVIKAADDGEVVYSGNELRGYGNMLLIKHNNGYLTAYAHAADISVKKGDIVTKGQAVGHIGQTGHVSSPQLHFSIRQGRKAIDPEKYLP